MDRAYLEINLPNMVAVLIMAAVGITAMHLISSIGKNALAQASGG